MLPTLAQVCSLPSPLEQDFEDYAAGQCQSIELWFTKLETYLERHSLDDFRALRTKHGVQTPVASFQGGLLDSQGERRREAWNLFTKRLDMCRELEIGTVVVACDVARPLDQTAIERVQVSLGQIAKECGQRGLRAALEFQAGSAFGNNLQTAVALVTDVGSPHLGLCLDLFHFACGPSKTEDLGYLNRDNLFHVQMCDLADTPRELATDSHRILPGDGELPIPVVVDMLKSIHYTGAVSVELLNPHLWQVPPRQFGEIALTSLRRVLGLSSM